MNKATIKWLAPAPLWKDLAQNNIEAFTRPEILEFDNDAFMEELLNQVEKKPLDLSLYKAKSENWRGEPLSQFKLYQPAHQRHYLVTASLVCQMPGLPDRHVETGRQENTGFVMRRLLLVSAASSNANPQDKREEYALVTNSQGCVWTRVLDEDRTSPDVLIPGEEVLPMFPIYYVQKDSYRRRVFAGTIPVAKREIYENSLLDIKSSAEGNANASNEKAGRKIFFQTQIIAPWLSLIENADVVKNGILLSESDKLFGVDLTDAEIANRISENGKSLKAAREQIQIGSWYILLDLAKYIQKYLPKIDKAIANPDSTELNSYEEDLFNRLGQTKLSTDLVNFLIHNDEIKIKNLKINLRDALKAIFKPENESGETRDMTTLEEDLDKIDVAYPNENPDHSWPKFLFPLADPKYGHVLPEVDVASEDRSDLDKIFSQFLEIIDKALPIASTVPALAVPLSAQLSKQGKPEIAAGVYVIRCIYQRPQCHPWKDDVVSERTLKSFQLASFFDPDAPGRPIRIALPEDPTPAGLRKYAKNTAFMVSDVLCGQMSAMKKVTFGDLVRSVLPWPFHKDLPIKKGDIKPCPDSIGRICSLSIPIVTICAMFLLMMIVFILDTVFRWTPWFITCFPLPNFKSKK